jgi:hypothetical protein
MSSSLASDKLSGTYHIVKEGGFSRQVRVGDHVGEERAAVTATNTRIALLKVGNSRLPQLLA